MWAVGLIYPKMENTDKLTQGLRWIQTHDIRGKLTHL
jgi:hypothetical protein